VCTVRIKDYDFSTSALSAPAVFRMARRSRCVYVCIRYTPRRGLRSILVSSAAAVLAQWKRRTHDSKPSCFLAFSFARRDGEYRGLYGVQIEEACGRNVHENNKIPISGRRFLFFFRFSFSPPRRSAGESPPLTSAKSKVSAGAGSFCRQQKQRTRVSWKRDLNGNGINNKRAGDGEGAIGARDEYQKPNANSRLAHAAWGSVCTHTYGRLKVYPAGCVRLTVRIYTYIYI